MYTIADREFDSLDAAMQYAKTTNEFVVIKGKDFELCGKFGVDSVENATLPDGHEYTWNKHKDRLHKSWRKKLG